MILPNKYLSVRSSLVGIGAWTLPLLTEPRSVSALWEELRASHEGLSFDRFVLTLDFLFAISLITMRRGLIARAEPAGASLEPTVLLPSPDAS